MAVAASRNENVLHGFDPETPRAAGYGRGVGMSVPLEFIEARLAQGKKFTIHGACFLPNDRHRGAKPDRAAQGWLQDAAAVFPTSVARAVSIPGSTRESADPGAASGHPGQGDTAATARPAELGLQGDTRQGRPQQP